MAGSICHNTFFMGSNKFDNGIERQQHESGSRIIHLPGSNDLHGPTKRIIKMAETKFAALILNLIGIPLCFISFLDNIGTIKSAVLFMCALCFLLIRMYFFVIWAKQKTEKQQLENDRERARGKMEDFKFKKEMDDTE